VINNNTFLSVFNKKKKYFILDYGCGTGIWNDELINKSFFKLIYLYDKNKEAIQICKNKYSKNKKIIIISKKKDIEKIFKNKEKIRGAGGHIVNVVLLNSVIQYFDKKKLEKLLLKFKKIFIKNFLIIIGDIPKYNRFIEFFILFFFDTVRFFHAVNLIFKFNSYRYDVFYLKNLDVSFLKLYFKFSKINNINYFRFRETYLLKNKSMF